jgi:hypothetical protein
MIFVSASKTAYQYIGLVVSSLAAPAVTLKFAELRIYGTSGCVTVRLFKCICYVYMYIYMCVCVCVYTYHCKPI